MPMPSDTTTPVNAPIHTLRRGEEIEKSGGRTDAVQDSKEMREEEKEGGGRMRFVEKGEARKKQRGRCGVARRRHTHRGRARWIRARTYARGTGLG
eukprot:1121427-Pyramimonas_sp.AAC.5